MNEVERLLDISGMIFLNKSILFLNKGSYTPVFSTSYTLLSISYTFQIILYSTSYNFQGCRLSGTYIYAKFFVKVLCVL